MWYVRAWQPPVLRAQAPPFGGCELTACACPTQALREASEAEALARTAEERFSTANAETAEELRETQERLRVVEVSYPTCGRHHHEGMDGCPFAADQKKKRHPR